MNKNKIKIGVVGLGTVGSGVINLLEKNNKSFFSILFLNLKFIFKLKMILMLYFPKLASIVIRFKWIIDKKRFSNT